MDIGNNMLPIDNLLIIKTLIKCGVPYNTDANQSLAGSQNLIYKAIAQFYEISNLIIALGLGYTDADLSKTLIYKNIGITQGEENELIELFFSNIKSWFLRYGMQTRFKHNLTKITAFVPKQLFDKLAPLANEVLENSAMFEGSILSQIYTISPLHLIILLKQLDKGDDFKAITNKEITNKEREILEFYAAHYAKSFNMINQPLAKLMTGEELSKEESEKLIKDLECNIGFLLPSMDEIVCHMLFNQTIAGMIKNYSQNYILLQHVSNLLTGALNIYNAWDQYSQDNIYNLVIEQVQKIEEQKHEIEGQKRKIAEQSKVIEKKEEYIKEKEGIILNVEGLIKEILANPKSSIDAGSRAKLENIYNSLLESSKEFSEKIDIANDIISDLSMYTVQVNPNGAVLVDKILQ